MNYQAAIDLQKQVAFIAALLSGFSITFFVGLLQFQAPAQDRLRQWCLIGVAFSTCCLILSTLASMSGAYWLTERPHLSTLGTPIDNPEVDYAFDWSAISFLAGLISLLVSIGLSGRLHARTTGILTLSFSFFTIVLIFFFWMYRVQVN
jgi:hypothetical protein